MPSSNLDKSKIARDLKVDDDSRLIVSECAVEPELIRESFRDLFKKVKERSVLIKNGDELQKIAEPWITTRTKHDTAVYNEERYYARIKSNTKHTTFLRDVEITDDDLSNMTQSFELLSKDVPIYRVYVKAGSGSEQVWIEMFFTPEGVKLAQVAAIMMEISFEEPKEEIKGRFFAMPEYQDILDSEDPLELIFIPDPDEAWFFVGGTTYPGDIYKPVCKYMNARIYAHGGAEIHGAGVVFSYNDPETSERKRKVVIISGLSLHGKSTLSMSDIGEYQKKWFAKKLNTDVDSLDMEIKLLHDDYVFVKPSNNGNYEVGVYAPNGIFPAMIDADPDNPITGRPDAILFNSPIEGDTPDFTRHFKFTNKRTGEVSEVQNPRAAAPIKGSFEVDTWDNSVIDEFDSFYYITLTRDPAAPSSIRWKTFSDALKYAAGLVVAPTDAVVDKADDFYLNYMCTDFDVAPRAQFLARMNNLLKSMQRSGIDVECYTINTGPPEKKESLAVRDSIILNAGKWKQHSDLGIDYLEEALGFRDVYRPWEIDCDKDWTVTWKEMRDRRQEFFKDKYIDYDKADLDDNLALI